MKLNTLLFSITCLIVSSCTKNPPSDQLEANQSTHSQAELSDSKTKLHNDNLQPAMNIRGLIQSFNLKNDRYPNSIKELTAFFDSIPIEAPFTLDDYKAIELTNENGKIKVNWETKFEPTLKVSLIINIEDDSFTINSI